MASDTEIERRKEGDSERERQRERETEREREREREAEKGIEAVKENELCASSSPLSIAKRNNCQTIEMHL